MANGNTRKPSSPTRDALRLFFRNPSSVVALLLILTLAAAAVSGKLFTGAKPSMEQVQSMQDAEEIGDVVDLDVNEWAILDPEKTELKDKFLSPLSDSRVTTEELQDRLKNEVPPDQRDAAFERRVENAAPTYYPLGTDHLGRNVLAQLWAGSTISLTIGFLAVGISVLLGVSLGGIAGFFGRRPVGLPLLITLLSGLIGGIAIPAEAPLAGVVFFAIAGVLFSYQVVVALAGRRFRSVIVFAVIAILSIAIFSYNSYIENSTPEGEILQEARDMEELSKDVLLLTRDLGREKKDAENRLPHAKEAEWFPEQQMQLEMAYRNLYIAEQEYELAKYLAELKMDERLGKEQLERAEHVRGYVKEFGPATGNEDAAERRERQKSEARAAMVASLEKAGNARVERMEKALPAVLATADSVRQAIDAAQEAAALPEDFDASNEAARLERILKAQTALENVKRELLLLHVVEHTAAAGLALEITDKFSVADAKAAIAKRRTELQPEVDGTDEKAKERAAAKLGDLKQAESYLDRVAALDKDLKEKSERSKAWIENGIPEAERERLDGYDYTDLAAQNKQTWDPYYFQVESSVKLLNRRADLRTRYLKKYEAEAKNRFEDAGGVLEAKLLNGEYRYNVYTYTRHFLMYTILIVLLSISALVVAASAQGAAEDIGGPLAAPFIGTISVDDLVMRFTEIMMTIPVIFLILAVLALFKKDVYIVMAVIGLTSWMTMTRFVRAEILSLREQDFIQAARALGVSDFRIVWRHLVPNAISPVLVSATLGVATAVLAESTLSFLGIGAGEDQPTWGQILSNGRSYITDASWLTWIPGVAILITVLSFNLLGEGLREAFNPKLRGR